MQNARKILFGNISIGECQGNTVTEYEVTFQEPFDTTPYVITGVRSGSSASTYGNCFCFADGITPSGFTFKFANANTDKIEPSGTWIALNI